MISLANIKLRNASYAKSVLIEMCCCLICFNETFMVSLRLLVCRLLAQLYLPDLPQQIFNDTAGDVRVFANSLNQEFKRCSSSGYNQLIGQR